MRSSRSVSKPGEAGGGAAPAPPVSAAATPGGGAGLPIARGVPVPSQPAGGGREGGKEGRCSGVGRALQPHLPGRRGGGGGAERGAARPAAGMAGKGRAPAGSGDRGAGASPRALRSPRGRRGPAVPPLRRRLRPRPGARVSQGLRGRWGGCSSPLPPPPPLSPATCSGPASGSPFLEERLRAGRRGKRCTPRPPWGGRRGAPAGKRGAGSRSPSPRPGRGVPAPRPLRPARSLCREAGGCLRSRLGFLGETL